MNALSEISKNFAQDLTDVLHTFLHFLRGAAKFRQNFIKIRRKIGKKTWHALKRTLEKHADSEAKICLEEVLEKAKY